MCAKCVCILFYFLVPSEVLPPFFIPLFSNTRKTSSLLYINQFTHQTAAQHSTQHVTNHRQFCKTVVNCKTTNITLSDKVCQHCSKIRLMLCLLSIVETKPNYAASEYNCRMTISIEAVGKQRRLGSKHLDHRNAGKLRDPNTRKRAPSNKKTCRIGP